MYQPAVTVPLLTAYLSALPTALLQDPHLDTGTARWAIGRLTENPDAAGTAAAAVRQHHAARVSARSRPSIAG